MKENILVVGGYGHVGKDVCRELGKIHPGKVIAAGRNLAKARDFCQTTSGSVRPLQLNIEKPFDPEILSNVKLVVMCLDQVNSEFVQLCFRNGIHYVDISANYHFLSQIEKLNVEAKTNNVTSILSVGLSPGLTNLLAGLAKQQIGGLHDVDIYILLGIGDHHGKAAIEWALDSLISDFYVVENNNMVKIGSFTDGKRTFFGEGMGHRVAYRFNFSDQHVIPNTIEVPTVSTRLCFDSAIVTYLLSLFKKSGLVRFLKSKPIRDGIVKLYSVIKNYGNEVVVVKVEAKGEKGDVNLLRGKKNEAVITAKVAALVSDIVYRSTLPYGVYHVEQLFDWGDIWAGIQHIASLETRLNGNIISHYK